MTIHEVRLLAAAQHELDDAFVWYNTQAVNLGYDFLDEFDRAIRRSVTFPLGCPEIDPGLRRCLLNRFPYGMINGLDGETLIVVAVAHLHRKPSYWIDRA